MAQDVSHFYDATSKLKTLDEGRLKKKELEEEIQQPRPEPENPQMPLPGATPEN
jgi:hypothetical protein